MSWSRPTRSQDNWGLLAAIVIALLLSLWWATNVGAQTPDAPCVNLPPRELQAWIGQAAIDAAHLCPQAPACVCPELPREIEVCRQSWNGKIVRCKKFAWKAIPK